MTQKVNFKKISTHKSAEESPGLLLWQVSTLWRRAIEAVLKPHGLTHPQFVVLATIGWLTRTGGRASQADIGRQAATDPNTTSQILRSLQAKKLIKRSITHKRTKYPILTAMGATLLSQALPAVESADALFFASVDLEKTKLLKTLQNLVHPPKIRRPDLLQMMKLDGIPGLSLALISGHQITTFEFGVKNTLSKEPVTSTTVFEGASLSKPVMAYAALKLCKEGLLDLDRPLSSYLTDHGLAGVTLRHILSHTGGFPTANLKPGEDLKLNSKPGSQFAYSGESFRYLEKVIEHITGMTLASYMHKRVFNPLKMKNSSFVWKKKYDALAASPHNQKGKPLQKWKPNYAIASFSLHTTAADFAKFMIAAKQLPKMSEPSYKINKSISWGLGWGIEIDSLGRKGIWHSGDNGSFQCLAFQNHENGFVIMTNSPNGMKIYGKIFDLLIGGAHPLLDWEEFDARAAEKLDEKHLANWWRIYDF